MTSDQWSVISEQWSKGTQSQVRWVDMAGLAMPETSPGQHSKDGLHREFRSSRVLTSHRSLVTGHCSRGFTLVELLVVIAILTILIGLVTAGAQAARRRGAITKAKATIASLETAIAMYNGDLGTYPVSDNANLVTALQDDPGDPDWQGPYMEFKQDELVNGELVDPWGNPYAYVSINGGSPTHRPRSYDLYSLGPNGADDDGTGDDIVNW